MDGVRVNMSSIHQAFEKKLETEFRLLNKSVRALNKNDSELTSTINELRQSQILTRRISKRLAVNVTELESRVQELKTSSSNMSIRAGRLEKGYTQMNTLMKTLEDVNDAQNASSDNLRSLYVSLRDSLASVNATMNEKVRVISEEPKKVKGLNFRYFFRCSSSLCSFCYYTEGNCGNSLLLPSCRIIHALALGSF